MPKITFVLVLVLAACSSPPAQLAGPTSNVAQVTLESAPTETALQSNAPSPEPTLPTPTTFTSPNLRAGIEPVQYLTDACQAMTSRWDPEGAVPGTVVAPIMFHSILEGNEQPSIDQDINSVTFAEIITQAERLGFETITTEELLAFLETNAKIPPRSMIMILDDRRAGTAEEHFLPILEAKDWTVTMAWIALADTDQRDGLRAGESLWDSIERLFETGYLDIQAHGRDHVYLQEEMSEETVRQEIAGSLPPLKEHFGITPPAYIWPGGNYTQVGLNIAHEVGFELGFTIHSRGPVMFDWVPQGEKERAFNDPLMLLPRYWSSAAVLNLQQAAEMGSAARQFARDNYAAEAAWFSQNCGGELPPMKEVLRSGD